MQKRPNVYVTRMIPEAPLTVLKEHCDVEINPDDRPLTRQELLAKVRGRDAVLSLLTDTIDDEVFMAAGSQCKVFANYAVGFNNVDVAAATKRGVIITNTPGVLDNATAEIAWALLFAVARRVAEADKFARAGLFQGWGPMMFLGQEIMGKTLGVIGTGRIGSKMARGAQGFGMRVLCCDEFKKTELEKDLGATYVDKDTLLKESDYVSLHTPLMPSTTHLISDREFKLMKKTAILINSSRGPIVDEKALVRALQAGEIWGAGLDVFENEPAIEPELRTMDNVVILPHIASATIEARTQMGMIAVRNIIKVLNGEAPETCVNPEVLKNS